MIANAATSATVSTFVDKIVGLISDALFLLMAVAVLVFIWQVIKYFILPNEDRKGAGLYVMYSIIGFFVILSMWGLVAVLSNTFGLGNATNSPSSWTEFMRIFPRG